MSYIALARKWRPRTFSQLVGQEHVCKALTYSLDEQRMHHAYLFTGTRGVGKTSIARLVAKSLNCEQGVTSTPCLECDACISIEQGRFLDLIEIDGASKTRVEDTRELLENVQYAPTSGRFKIYLIDEVHMLSQHSFNALLKTLEEPPAHVKFLLATTDPQKLPVTVLSRCLQFNLKPLTAEVISQQLKDILAVESKSYEEAALTLLAHAARGSMRDALSLLDQVIACSEHTIAEDEVKNVLGYTRQDYALQLLQALVPQDLQQILVISRQIAKEGANYHYVLEELLSHLHEICISQHLPLDNTLLQTNKEIVDLGKQILPEDCHLYYQIALKGLGELHLAPTPAIGFEMALLRMHTFKPAQASPRPDLVSDAASDTISKPVTEPISPAKPCASEPKSAPAILEKASAPTQEPMPHTEPKPASLSNNLSAAQPPEENATSKNISWDQIIQKIQLKGLALSAAEHAEFICREDNIVRLLIEQGHQSLFTPTVMSRIEAALSDYYKAIIKLDLSTETNVCKTPAQRKKTEREQELKQAEQALQSDPFFQKLQQEFSGELVKNTIDTNKQEI